ncbi:MAG TPA: DUF4332 domain-containing protein [Myxococcota bacterium]|nr:DUF4332 domain-containing protein [Myxococcota bacterium]HQK51587.1 DUF4332 domain-containing protein [Myxococcota bacterium]
MKRHGWRGVILGALWGAVIGTSLEARAGHYELASIEWADPATLATLASAGIETTEDLWKATTTAKGIERLSRKTRIEQPRLREWHRFCDLLFIDGVGPRVARVLTESGVRDRRELARQDPEALTRLIEETNRRIGVLGKLPDVDSVRIWIEQAQRLVGPPGTRRPR